MADVTKELPDTPLSTPASLPGQDATTTDFFLEASDVDWKAYKDVTNTAIPSPYPHPIDLTTFPFAPQTIRVFEDNVDDHHAAKAVVAANERESEWAVREETRRLLDTAKHKIFERREDEQGYVIRSKKVRDRLSMSLEA
jgi:hypothetical protein